MGFCRAALFPWEGKPVLSAILPIGPAQGNRKGETPEALIAGRELPVLILSNHAPHKLDEPSDSLSVPDLFDFGSQPDSACQIEAKLKDFSLQEVPQAPSPRER